MPSVLMIGPDPKAQGGMATVEKNTLDAIRACGDRAKFVSTYVEGNRLKKLVVAADAYIRFFRLLGSCDLVHVHMASRGSYERKRIFMRAAFKRGVPVLLHLHSGEFALWFDSECSEAKREEIRETFQSCSKVIVLSEEWRDCLVERGICDSERIAVLHNAVVVPPRPGEPCSRQDVLFLGRLDANKSPDVLLRASGLVLGRHPETRVLLAGDGNLSRYERLAFELGILERCDFLGWVAGEDKVTLFERAAVYCLPSKNEGMPMGVLEAMSYGLPVIATPVGGVPQVIDDGVDGFLMPVDNVEALAELLDRLLGDPGLRGRAGSAARKTVEERFSMDSYVRRLVALYKEIVSANEQR